jgi:hypothetical protein
MITLKNNKETGVQASPQMQFFAAEVLAMLLPFEGK